MVLLPQKCFLFLVIPTIDLEVAVELFVYKFRTILDLCFYIYLLHDIIKVWLEYILYIFTYRDLCLQDFRHIMYYDSHCFREKKKKMYYDLVGGRGRLVKVF